MSILHHTGSSDSLVRGVPKMVFSIRFHGLACIFIVGCVDALALADDPPLSVEGRRD